MRFPGSHGWVVSECGIFVRGIAVFTGWHWHWSWKGFCFVVLLCVVKQSIDICPWKSRSFRISCSEWEVCPWENVLIRTSWSRWTICPWKGRILRTFSGCIYEMSPVLASQFSDLLRGGAVLFYLKRFLGTKRCKKFILFRLKRFRGTKLYEDCRLWPAAWCGKDSSSVAYRSAWPGRQPHMEFFISILISSMVSRGTAKLMKQKNRQGLLQNLACSSRQVKKF